MTLHEYIQVVSTTEEKPFHFISERIKQTTGIDIPWWVVKEKVGQKSMNVKTALLFKAATDGLCCELEDFVMDGRNGNAKD